MVDTEVLQILLGRRMWSHLALSARRCRVLLRGGGRRRHKRCKARLDRSGIGQHAQRMATSRSAHRRWSTLGHVCSGRLEQERNVISSGEISTSKNGRPRDRQQNVSESCLKIAVETADGKDGAAEKWPGWTAFEFGEGTIGGLK